MRTIDSFDFADVDLIKIDTEGFETDVIKGALETIDRWRPNIILEQADLEIHYGYKPKSALKILQKMGMVVLARHGPDYIMSWR